ncbi:TPA: dihydrolipoyl dehydrogenase [Candidatus Poribacteria bacterium]|nr:dihydrolipoyl dehydrogenase [Candidatus Poribacteria bacterium]
MSKYDLTIIGGGPGGYVAAIRASQLGMKTALIEREAVGGVCLNWGCIPSKSLLKNAEVLSYVKEAEKWGITFDNMRYDLAKAMDRSRQVAERLVNGVKFLLKKNKVDVYEGEGFITKIGQIEVRPKGELVEAKNIIVATGARPRIIPGLKFDGEVIISSYDALKMRTVPKNLVVVGGGAIGVEFAYFYRTYGSEVTIIEMLPHILPNEDEEISIILEKSLTKYGISVSPASTVNQISIDNGKAKVKYTSPSGEKEIESEKVLISIGVQGNSENLGLENLGVKIEKGFIQVNDKMATNVEGIYAIGDVTGPPLLAHVASAQGIHAVEGIAGREIEPLSYEDMPRATYCHPQVASFGLTEAQAKAKGIKVKIGKFPFLGNGKAIAIDDFEGIVKLVVDAEYGELLGAHIIGPEASELLASIRMAKELEYSAEDVGRTVHAHPTLSEAIMEAALSASEGAIHI